jgi:type II secretory ATPase GspE/PulE/Tfp pilus assembly ATPase PilB-like protein
LRACAGRFKLKTRGRAIDFRVSIMPTIHGEDAVIRMLDKENLSEEFRHLIPTCGQKTASWYEDRV